MQARRFRADIESADLGRIALLSTSWQTSVLMAPQDRDYRAFIVELHRRMKAAGSGPKAREEGVLIAREMLSAVRDRVAGAYIMPPLGRYEMALDVIDGIV